MVRTFAFTFSIRVLSASFQIARRSLSTSSVLVSLLADFLGLFVGICTVRTQGPWETCRKHHDRRNILRAGCWDHRARTPSDIFQAQAGLAGSSLLVVTQSLRNWRFSWRRSSGHRPSECWIRIIMSRSWDQGIPPYLLPHVQLIYRVLPFDYQDMYIAVSIWQI